MLHARIEDIESYEYLVATMSLIIGMLVGQIVFGLFGDTLGRRRSFFGSSIVMLIGSVLSIFSGMLTNQSKTTIIEFSTTRFILGVGAGGSYDSLFHCFYMIHVW
jgi:PHS family inorganic phosphate transporter-like MFS transporter